MDNFTYERKKGTDSTTIYETYEWDNTWIEHANDTKHRRVLYIGDSISCGARRIATAQSNESIFFDGFGTSKALDNPYFKDSVRVFMHQLPSFESVIFNNGLHGWHLDDETDFKTLYDETVSFLLNEIGDAKLFILLTTSVADKERNNRVVKRNAVTSEIAEKYRLSVIDLYTITNQNIDMLVDGVHPNEARYKKIADEIIQHIKS